MAIIIKKRTAEAKPEPEALVAPRKAPAVAPAPKASSVAQAAYHSLPVAATVEELMASKGQMRAPDPTVCKMCGSVYGYPCHGQNPKCMNVIYAKRNAKMEKA